MSNQSFINSIGNVAKEVASKNGLYASVMIAQAILESNWGKSTLAKSPNFNLFGIKGSYDGKSVSLPTSEYINKQWIRVNAKFRKYPSYKESLQDNANLLKNGLSWDKNYYSKTWKKNTKNYMDATKALTGTYATDPSYNSKLNALIKTHGLTKYDSANSGSEKVDDKTESYKIQSGDTLIGIASKFSTTVNELLKINPSIKNKNKIISGQVINIKLSTKNYTIKSGETLSGIAIKNKTTINEILRLNPSIKNKNKIFAGQKIKLPK